MCRWCVCICMSVCIISSLLWANKNTKQNIEAEWKKIIIFVVFEFLFLYYIFYSAVYLYIYVWSLYVCMWVEDSASIIHDIPGSKKKLIKEKEKQIDIEVEKSYIFIHIYILYSLSYHIILFFVCCYPPKLCLQNI